MIQTKMVLMPLFSKMILAGVGSTIPVNTLTHVMVTLIVMEIVMALMRYFLKMTLAEVTSTTLALLVQWGVGAHILLLPATNLTIVARENVVVTRPILT